MAACLPLGLRSEMKGVSAEILRKSSSRRSTPAEEEEEEEAVEEVEVEH